MQNIRCVTSNGVVTHRLRTTIPGIRHPVLAFVGTYTHRENGNGTLSQSETRENKTSFVRVLELMCGLQTSHQIYFPWARPALKPSLVGVQPDLHPSLGR